ncbi:MAG: T9SS type A sorting domain-containing protein, partial [Bacteroidales bacterium]|nr:T9SS type A sorting domain-containing protein [Bacteroidales bacterium]
GTVLSTTSRLIQTNVTRNTSYTVLVTNGSDCWAVETTPVTVNPLPVASISGVSSVCYGSAATFTASGGVSYEWYRGSSAVGTVVSTSSTYTTPALTTNTFITVRVTSASGCQSTYTHEISINPLPTPTITGNTMVMEGNGTTLTAFGGVAYEWYAGPRVVGTPIANTAQLNTPDLFANTYYTVLVTDALGCAASTSQLIQVTDRLSATVSGTTTVIQGDVSPVVTFRAINGTSPYTFSYNINGGETLTISTTTGTNEATVTVPTDNPGTFVYNLLSVSDQNNNVVQLSASATVTVRSLLFDVSITGGQSVCVGDPKPTILFTISNGIYPFTFYYKINGGETNTITTYSSTVSIQAPTDEAGMFEYRIIGVEDPRMSQAIDKSTVVTVYEIPTINIIGETLVDVGQTTTLIAEGGSMVAWYAGQTPTGNVLATTAEFITPVIRSDTYFTVVVSNAMGCSAVQTIRVAATTTDIEDVTTIEEVSIYPNPAVTYFIVEIPSILPPDAYIEIFDISGRKIYQEKVDGRQEVRISVDNYKEGIYLVRIKSPILLAIV